MQGTSVSKARSSAKGVYREQARLSHTSVGLTAMEHSQPVGNTVPRHRESDSQALGTPFPAIGKTFLFVVQYFRLTAFHPAFKLGRRFSELVLTAVDNVYLYENRVFHTRRQMEAGFVNLHTSYRLQAGPADCLCCFLPLSGEQDIPYKSRRKRRTDNVPINKSPTWDFQSKPI